MEEGRTIILVSHDLHSVRSLCDRALWLEGGNVQEIGPAREVVDRYINKERDRSKHPKQYKPAVGTLRPPPSYAPETFLGPEIEPELREALLKQCRLENPAQHLQKIPTEAYDVVDGDQAIIQGSGEIRILDVHILDGEAHQRNQFHTGEDLIVAVTFRTTVRVERPIFGIALFRSDNLYIHGPNTRFDQTLDDDFDGVYTFFIRWNQLPLLSGDYKLSIAVFDKNHIKPHVWHNQLYDFSVHAPMEDHGIAVLKHNWGLITHLEHPQKAPIEEPPLSKNTPDPST